MKVFFSVTLLVYICYLIGVTSAKANSRYVVMFNKLNCTYNAKYVRTLTCDIVEPEKQRINSNLIYAVDIADYTYNARARMNVPRPNGQNLNLFDIEFNVCTFFDKESDNNVLKIARQSWDMYGNYTSCPHRKDIALSLFNWYVDVSKIPFAPETDFVLTVVFYLRRNIEIINVELQGSFGLRRKRAMQVFN